ncbi:MAG TPA: F0F1 ATP synthase subunit A [Pirellulales bacterium]|jgi:F-type H+-transporting ATPase subunit a|nr:F0F1 ATP synthase subunit A [Pirellulales bacterium]
MADSILHIKDSYYFDVPRTFWRSHRTSLDQVPKYLTDAHPHATLAEFNDALTGKILIPQPFGTLKNFYERQSGFAISKFMIIELIIAAVLVFMFSRLAARVRRGEVLRGRGWNLLESMVVFIRNDVARPAIGAHDADRFLPLLWTMFFFILTCNLFGMLPWLGAPTGTFSVTLALAGITFVTILVSGVRQFGPFGFFKNLVPPMDLPWYMLIFLWPFILIIEVFGLLIRNGVLAIRLLANMVAGHLVLLAVLGLAFTIEAAASHGWAITAIISILGSTLFSLLELFVAFLQAYIFTFLSALFIGAAIHHH